MKNLFEGKNKAAMKAAKIAAMKARVAAETKKKLNDETIRAGKNADNLGGHLYKHIKKGADGSYSQKSIGRFSMGSKDASKLIKATGFGLGAGGGAVAANKIVKESRKKTPDNKKKEK